MKPYKTKIRGKVKWRVKIPNITGGYKIKTFTTRDEAQVVADNWKLARKSASIEAAKSATSQDLADWAELDKKLREYRLSLSMVAQERLDALHAVEVQKSLDEALCLYLKHLRREGVSDAYYRDLKTRLTAFTRVFGGDKMCDTFVESQILGWLGVLEVKATTRDNYRRAVSAFFGWCEKKNWIAKNPTPLSQKSVLKRVKEQSSVSYLSIRDVSNLLEKLDRQDDLEMRVVIALRLFAGIRADEFRKVLKKTDPKSGSLIKEDVFLTWREIDLKHASVFISGKLAKKKSRRVPLPDCLVAWLEKWVSEAHAPVDKNTPLVPINHARKFRLYKRML